MYHQLRQDLLARIRRGEFPPGSQLPSENQLCEHYGVSVTTARRAFLELVKEGVVKRKAGVGTTVSSQVRRARLAFVSIDYVGDAWRNISSIMGEIIAGVGEYTWKHDATLNMIGVEDDEASTYLRSLVEERAADGVLLRVANDLREEHLDILEQAGFPYVVIKRRIPGRKMNCVISDDVVGARMATSHLLDLGYERIGFVCAKPGVMLGRERLKGYRAALAERGVGFDETLVRHEPYFTSEMGCRGVRSLLEMSSPPEAIFVASDTMALGGYGAARDLGLEIPDDLALVGYDDIAPAAVLQPPLTTIRTSFYDFGAMAAELLLELIDGKELAPQQRTIHPALIIRGSTQKTDSSAIPSADRKTAREHPAQETSEPANGRLSGKTVVCAGSDRSFERRIARACEAEGARVELAENLHRTGISGSPDEPPVLDGVGRADVLVYSLTLRDMGHDLKQALAYVRLSVEKMAGRGLDSVIYVASSAAYDSIGEVERLAAQAALEQAVGTLAREWKAKGVRVNAVVSEGSVGDRSGGDVSGTVLFMASDEAASISGESLRVGETGGTTPMDVGGGGHDEPG